MRVDKLALKIAIILAIIASSLGILIQVLPVAEYKGLINGYIAFAWNDLRYDREKLNLPFMNMIIVRGIFLIISCIFLFTSTIFLIICLRKSKELKYTINANSLFFASSLVNLFVSTMPLQSYELTIRMISSLNNFISNSRVTSAGIQYFYSSTVKIFDLNWLIIVNIIIAILLVALITYVISQALVENEEITKKTIVVPLIIRNIEEDTQKES